MYVNGRVRSPITVPLALGGEVGVRVESGGDDAFWLELWFTKADLSAMLAAADENAAKEAGRAKQQGEGPWAAGPADEGD